MQLKCFRTVLNIQDPETGLRKAIRIKIKNFTIDESTQFARDYHKSANPESSAMLCRKDAADEQEKEVLDAGTSKERSEFKIAQSEINKRRLSEMDEKTRAIYDKMDAEEEAFSKAFIVDTLKRFVRVEAGQDLNMSDDFENDDAQPKPISNGVELAHALGSREDVIRDLIRMVHLENTQTPIAKKVLRPLFGFVLFSAEHETAAVGQTPGQTADDASKPVSVATVDALPITTDQPSGSAATD
jgi:hypothetical protein